MADYPTHERDLIEGLDSKGDGRGIGPTLAPHLDEEGREIQEERRILGRGVGETPTFNDETPDSAEATGEGAPEHDPRDRQDDRRDLGGANEQQGARQSHARGQSGDMAGAAPDPLREQRTRGSINDTEGL